MGKPQQFASDLAKVLYIISNLQGDALSWAAPLVEEQSPLLRNYPRFKEEFKKVFERKFLLQASCTEFIRLKQGSRDLTAYLVHFQSLAAKLKWQEQVQYTVFLQGLREELRESLFNVHPMPRTLSGLVDLVLMMDQKLKDRKAEAARGAQKVFPKSSYARRGEELAKGSTRLGRFAEQSTKEKSSVIEAVRKITQEDSRKSGIPRGPLTEEEKDRRRREGLCLYCGKAGHLVKDCRLVKFMEMESVPQGEGVSEEVQEVRVASENEFTQN